MAQPNSADKAKISELESSLKENLIKICETEQRSKLLSTLLRLELLTRDVKNFTKKQLPQRRSLGSRGLGKQIFKTGKQIMLDKLLDNRRTESKLRQERNKLRNELESMVSMNVFIRTWKKLKAKIQRIRQEIKDKNNEKIKGYVEERNQEEHEELSILQEEMGEFGKLRIFSREQILPEERKPTRMSPCPSMSWRCCPNTPSTPSGP